VPIKQQRGHQFNNKKVRDNRENSAREKCRIWRKPIMLWWPYLWNPPLGHAEFLIYYSSHSPLLTDQRDLKEHNPFERNHHLKFPGKQKEIHLQGSFGRQTDFSLVHRWSMFILGYVVLLYVSFIMDGGD
jgi:hypothetical protein